MLKTINRFFCWPGGPYWESLCTWFWVLAQGASFFQYGPPGRSNQAYTYFWDFGLKVILFGEFLSLNLYVTLSNETICNKVGFCPKRLEISVRSVKSASLMRWRLANRIWREKKNKPRCLLVSCFCSFEFVYLNHYPLRCFRNLSTSAERVRHPTRRS